MSVYFIQAGEAGPIKIGFALNPLNRLRDLQTAHHQTLFLIGVMDGERSVEATLHRKFAAARLSGEWFKPVVELKRLARENEGPVSSIVGKRKVHPWPKDLFLRQMGQKTKQCPMNLLKHLIEHNLSGADFARKLGTSRQTVNLWVRGETIPKPFQMALIVQVTEGDVQPNDFYNGSAA